jgi:hypothetical protein
VAAAAEWGSMRLSCSFQRFDVCSLEERKEERERERKREKGRKEEEQWRHCSHYVAGGRRRREGDIRRLFEVFAQKRAKNGAGSGFLL